MGTQDLENQDDDLHQEDNLEAEVQLQDQNQDDLEVDIVDDTPDEDKGRKPLGKDALAEEDDEALAVNAKFKKRIGELRHQAHDERRAREAAMRERDEAIRFAQETYRRAKEIEAQLNAGRTSYAKTYGEKANAMLAAAKEKYRKAYEAGDADAMTEASVELAAAQQEIAQAKHWEAEAQQIAQNALQEQDSGIDLEQPRQRVQPQRQQAAPEPDPLAVEWTKRNRWFGREAKMTAFAYGVHEELVSAGIHPVEDADEYYKAIDDEMRRRFPEFEWESVDSGTSQRANRTPQKRNSSSVAPVARTSSGKPNKVTLTKSQLAIAQSMGLTPQQYAAELIKLQKGE